ncbi:MAG TPA: glutaminase, partial [Tenacibaculum sp.]|nr:glutaminase [Tenacibaculum sp.]
MSFDTIIKEIYEEIKQVDNKGKIASYIPELLKVDSNSFGVYFSSNKGDNLGVGDYQDKFSIQSIAKVLSLSLAYSIKGELIWNRLGVEPSGTSYN